MELYERARKRKSMVANSKIGSGKVECRRTNGEHIGLAQRARPESGQRHDGDADERKT